MKPSDYHTLISFYHLQYSILFGIVGSGGFVVVVDLVKVVMGVVTYSVVVVFDPSVVV